MIFFPFLGFKIKQLQMTAVVHSSTKSLQKLKWKEVPPRALRLGPSFFSFFSFFCFFTLLASLSSLDFLLLCSLAFLGSLPCLPGSLFSSCLAAGASPGRTSPSAKGWACAEGAGEGGPLRAIRPRTLTGNLGLQERQVGSERCRLPTSGQTSEVRSEFWDQK